MADEPLKHHYIPVFYLKRWLGSDERISVFQKLHDKVRVKRKHPSATGYVKGLYTIPGLPPEQAQLLENEFMQQTDDLASRALQIFIKAEDGKAITIEPRLRFGWARFLYSLILRTPESLDRMQTALIVHAEETVDKYKDQYLDMRTPNDPATFEEFRVKFLANPLNVTTQPYLHRMIDSEEVLTHIAHMQWTIHDTWGAKDQLLTSDRPIIMTNGIAADDSHIAIPISPTQIFLAVNKEKTMRQIVRMNRNEIVRITNQKVSEQARKYVYGFSSTLLPLVSMHLGKMLPATPLETMKF